ncbi:MAG: hypothetical protein P8M07_02990 [Flavobacteriales bacterium]|nr:hypothetical protein [Flavobacteriales bacterium]
MKTAFTPLLFIALLLSFPSCADSDSTKGAKDWSAERWDITWHCPDSLGYDGYMQGSTSFEVSDTAKIHLAPMEESNVVGGLRNFFETMNAGVYENYIGNMILPESFGNDSLRDLAITLSYRWDSLGISNRTDDITVNYIAPLLPGTHYDMTLVDFSMTQTILFANHWTGNHRNSVRVLQRRYPGTEVDDIDSVWVNNHGDSIRRRALAVTVNSTMYGARRPASSELFNAGQFFWMIPGSEYQPGVWEVMDTLQLDSLMAHRQMHSPAARPIE